MNRIYIFAAIFFLPHLVFSQESTLDQKLIKKNRVKEVVSNLHIEKNKLTYQRRATNQVEKYDSNGNQIYLSAFDTIGKPSLELWNQYNNGDKVFEKIKSPLWNLPDSVRYFLTYKNGKIIRQERSDSNYTIDYSYNDKGELINKRIYNRRIAAKYNPKMKEENETYFYDTRGNQTEIFTLDGDFKIREFFKYDTLNQKIEWKWIYVESPQDTNGRVFIWVKYHYAQNGDLIEEEKMGGDGGDETIKYTYDSNGFLSKKESSFSVTEYVNDKNGNRLKEIYKSGSFSYEIEYKYTFW